MRIAVFTNQFPSKTSTFFLRDMRGLAETGIEIDVFALYPLRKENWDYVKPLIPQVREIIRATHHVHPARLLDPRLLRIFASRAVRRDILEIIRQSAGYGFVQSAKSIYSSMIGAYYATVHGRRATYDHVLAYWGNYAGTAAYLFCRMLEPKMRFSIFVHAGTDLYRDRIFLKEKLSYADRVFTCSNFNKEYILEKFEISQAELDSKLHIHHHGLDLGQLEWVNGESTHQSLVAVGNFVERKGFSFLLDAIAQLKWRGIGVDLVLIGDGEERASLERKCADLGIEDLVMFTGWLTFDDVKSRVMQATALVHPSRGLGDGVPNVIKEAMALGTPVIATRVAGIPELLDNDCGLLVNAGSPSEIAAAIEELLNDATKRSQLSTNARRRVESKFDLYRNGRMMADALTSVST